MAAIITRTGKGAAITQAENDANLDSLCGVNESQTGTTYTVDAADQNGTIEFSNASPVAVTLTLIATIIAANDTSDFQVTLKNIGAGTVTITPTTDTFDDGSLTKVLSQYEWITIQSDSTQTLWNIVVSSNASKVDGLDAGQFLRSDIDDVTTGNLTINKASPYLVINDSGATNGHILFRDNFVSRALTYWDRSSDAYIVRQYDVDGVTIASQMNFDQDGTTSVTVGSFDFATASWQIGSVAVTSDAAELNLLENATSTDITTSDLLAGVINAVYPIGSIYISTVATNPGTLLGVGTWVASGVGSVLVGVGTSDETYTLDDTGGASTETAHLHGVSITSAGTGNIGANQDGAPAIPWPSAIAPHTHNVVGNTANNSPSTGDNMPPYLTVQIWERTA